MIRYLATLAFAIAAALLTSYAKAEKVVVYQEGQLVNPQDVADVLGKTRSIRLLDEAPAPAPAPATSITTVATSSPATARPASPSHAEPGHDDAKASALS